MDVYIKVKRYEIYAQEERIDRTEIVGVYASLEAMMQGRTDWQLMNSSTDKCVAFTTVDGYTEDDAEYTIEKWKVSDLNTEQSHE